MELFQWLYPQLCLARTMNIQWFLLRIRTLKDILNASFSYNCFISHNVIQKDDGWIDNRSTLCYYTWLYRETLDLETLYHYICEKHRKHISCIPSHFFFFCNLAISKSGLKSAGLMKPFSWQFHCYWMVTNTVFTYVNLQHDDTVTGTSILWLEQLAAHELLLSVKIPIKV